MSAETVIVRGTGGALFEMDVPAGGFALERYQQSIAKGDLTVVTEPTEWVERGDGSKFLRIVGQGQPKRTPADAKPKRRGKAADDQATAEPPATPEPASADPVEGDKG